MAKCEVCENEYDKTFEIITKGGTHTFDCFECAIQALAPVCDQCGCKVIGHGVEASGNIYCCGNCAKQAGFKGITDRMEPTMAER